MKNLDFGSYSIKHISLADTEEYFNLVKDNQKRLEPFLASTVAVNRDIEATRAHLTEILEQHANKQYYFFILIDRLSTKIIGSVQLRNLDWKIPEAELVYFIDKRYEGKGITTKAVSRIIEFAFARLKLHRVYARVSKEDKGCIKVAEKNGFKATGMVPGDAESAGLALYELKNPAAQPV